MSWGPSHQPTPNRPRRTGLIVSVGWIILLVATAGDGSLHGLLVTLTFYAVLMGNASEIKLRLVGG
jgi:hypothetical protein